MLIIPSRLTVRRFKLLHGVGVGLGTLYSYSKRRIIGCNGMTLVTLKVTVVVFMS